MAGDIRNAIRQWARTPVITAVVVLSLALGIGANTAIFSLIDSLLIKSLPVRDPDRLVRVVEPGAPRARHPGLQADRRVADVFDSTAAMSLLRPDISNTPERRSAFGLAVNGGFFETLGVTPAIGRLLTPEDDAAGTPAVAVTDYEFWQAEYGGRPDILGATIRLDGKPFTIVGVSRTWLLRAERRPAFRRRDCAQRLSHAVSRLASTSISNSFAIIGRLKRRSDASPQPKRRCARCSQAIRAALQLPDNVRP